MLAAYLTFFPVAINALRGLQSADPRAVELMRSYAASRWRDPLEAPRARVAAVPLLRLQDLRAARVVGAIICEPAASIQGGLGGAIVNFNQYYSIEPQYLWATNIICRRCSASSSSSPSSLTEKLVLRRAPEHFA